MSFAGCALQPVRTRLLSLPEKSVIIVILTKISSGCVIAMIANIIINGVLFYQIHNNKIEIKNTATIPNMVSIGGAGGIFSMASLGFIPMPAPYLPILPNHLENTTYSLVLDLDETLAHFFLLLLEVPF